MAKIDLSQVKQAHYIKLGEGGACPLRSRQAFGPDQYPRDHDRAFK